MEAMPQLMALMADQLSLIAGIAKGYRTELLGAGFPPDHAQALATDLVRSLQGKLFGVTG